MTEIFSSDIIFSNKVNSSTFCGTSRTEAGNFFFRMEELCLPLYVGCNLQVALVDLPFRLIGNVITSKRCTNEAASCTDTHVFDIALQLCTLINGCNNSHRINSPLCFAGHYLHIMNPRRHFSLFSAALTLSARTTTHVVASRSQRGLICFWKNIKILSESALRNWIIFL